MNQIPCPDGYLLDAKSPLAAAHDALNTYLVRFEDVGWKLAIKEVNAIRDKKRKLEVWMALLERLEWLRENARESPYFEQLHNLTYSIEEWKLQVTEADLLLLLERTGRMGQFVMPYSPMPHLMSFVRDKGLTPALSASICEFATRVKAAGYYINQTRWQMLHSRLDMLAWRNEWDAIDRKRCWSERVREDFRAMQGAGRENWRRLLHRIDGDEGVRPSPKWLREANECIESIGPADFRQQLLAWIEPLQSGTAHPLSRSGGQILRCFLWLAGEFKDDPAIAASFDEVAGAKFKPKKNGDKAIRAAAEAAGKPDPTGRPPAPVPGFGQLLTRALEAVLSPASGLASAKLAGRVRIEEDVVQVSGQLDAYEVHIR